MQHPSYIKERILKINIVKYGESKKIAEKWFTKKSDSTNCENERLI